MGCHSSGSGVLNNALECLSSDRIVQSFIKFPLQAEQIRQTYDKLVWIAGLRGGHAKVKFLLATVPPQDCFNTLIKFYETAALQFCGRVIGLNLARKQKGATPFVNINVVKQ